jgi:hypothetical protein
MLLCPFILSAQPIQLHPDNPHYFLFRGTPTVLVTSAEHYGAVMNLDFDFVPYFEELAEHGLNQTRTFSGAYVEQWGAPWNSLNPPGGRFICPWARSSEGGYIDGGNKFDLETFDEEYFTRLRDFINEAGKYDVVVELVFFCVYYNDNEWNHSPLNSRNNINGIGSRGRHSPFNEDDQDMMRIQENMVKKIAEELKDLDNLYYELCNEPYWDEGPRMGDQWNDRIIAAVREVDTTHLIAINVANDYARIDSPTDHISIYNFHYSQPNSVRDNYDLPFAFGDDETGFDGSSDSPYRREAWDFILAGGAEYSNLDWSFTVDSERGDADNWNKDLGGGGQTIREQLSHLKQFMDGFGFLRMEPNTGFIQGGVPGGVQALAEEGQAYAVYLNGGSSANLNVELPAGNYTAEWLNTKTGDIDKTETFDHEGGEITLSSPDYSEDVALSIKVEDYQVVKVHEKTGNGSAPEGGLAAPFLVTDRLVSIPKGAVRVELFDLNGRRLWSHRLTDSFGKKEIHLPETISNEVFFMKFTY